jgi:hypothetical protein
MAHFVYAMQGSSKPPAGGGTTQGWFSYYKWDVNGEAFVPVPEAIPDGAPAPGDTLWFLMDSRVIGCVPVLRVSEDELNSQLEVYYDTRQLRDFGDQTKYFMAHSTGKRVSAGDISYYDKLAKTLAAEHAPRGDKPALAVAPPATFEKKD